MMHYGIIHLIAFNHTVLNGKKHRQQINSVIFSLTSSFHAYASREARNQKLLSQFAPELRISPFD